jgi:hypothetical protein
MTMAKASIQKTTISPGRVEILIADQALVEHATLWVQFSVPAQSDNALSIAEAQLRALQIVQTAIGSEIAAIKALEGRKP